MNARIPALDSQAVGALVDERWRASILPELQRYIAVPAKSPAFDPAWADHGYLDAVLRQALAGRPISVVADQVGAPTTAALVAETTCRVLGHVLTTGAADDLVGCYHLAAAGEVSRLGYACHVLARAQAAGLPLRTGPEQVAAVVSASRDCVKARSSLFHFPSVVQRQSEK